MSIYSSTDEPGVVYRSPSHAACNERLLVLLAVGLEPRIERDGLDCVLVVAPEAAAAAREQLALYQAESRPRPPPPAAPPAYPGALAASLLYAILLLGVTLMLWNGVGPLDAYGRGALHGAAVQAGEWWRAWTALTLHVDIVHVVSNAGFGAWIGYLAGRRLRPGIAWMLVIFAAGAANWIEGYFGPADHRSVGASTAVFAIVGLFAAAAWHDRRAAAPGHWSARWGPLVAGVVLLGWFGAQGEDGSTDVVAHVLGFVLGVLVGLAAASTRGSRVLARIPGWLAGSSAIAVIALAWMLASRA